MLYDNFNGESYKYVGYGGTMQTSMMVISVLVPNGEPATIYPVINGPAPEGMSSVYLFMPAGANYQRMRLDLKTQCRRLIFTCIEIMRSPMTVYFYNAQGAELGREVLEVGRFRAVQIDFKAPVGMFVSRVEVEAEGRYGFDNFVFEI